MHDAMRVLEDAAGKLFALLNTADAGDVAHIKVALDDLLCAIDYLAEAGRRMTAASNDKAKPAAGYRCGFPHILPLSSTKGVGFDSPGNTLG